MDTSVALPALPDGFTVMQANGGLPPLPDGFSVAAQNAVPVGDNNDVLKSYAGGAEQGAAGMAMFLPNLINQAATGPQLLGRGIAEGADNAINWGAKQVGSDFHVDPQPRGELWKPYYDSQDALNALPESLQPHQPTTPGGVIANTSGQLLGNILAGKGIQTLDNVPANVSTSFLKNNTSEPAVPTPTQPEIKAASGAAYQQMRDAGATLNKSGIDTVTATVDKDLAASGLMNTGLHGDTMSVIADMNKDAANGSMDLEKLDQYRQLLNQVVTKNTSKIDGANPDAYKANVAINALDNAVDSLGQQHLSNGSPQAIEALNNARGLYSAQAKMSTIQRIQDNAKMMDNPATAMRTGFKNLAKQVNVNPRGYTPEEIDAINYAAKTGMATGAAKLMGSRLISSMVGGMAGAGAGGIGAAAGAGGGALIATPLRALANAMQGSRGQAVSDMIANRPQVQNAMKLGQAMGGNP